MFLNLVCIHTSVRLVVLSVISLLFVGFLLCFVCVFLPCMVVCATLRDFTAWDSGFSNFIFFFIFSLSEVCAFVEYAYFQWPVVIFAIKNTTELHKDEYAMIRLRVFFPIGKKKIDITILPSTVGKLWRKKLSFCLLEVWWYKVCSSYSGLEALQKEWNFQ